MAPASKRSTTAELSLINLKTGLVNLPASLEAILLSVNTPIQNVIVEIVYRASSSSSNNPARDNASTTQKSAYMGWSGMPSKRKLAPIVDRNGSSALRGGSAGREHDLSLIEIDATFARALGLSDGQKVTAHLHLDPPLVHTVNIEPQTPNDWEMIELHANFLELNMLSQIRALPNPSYTAVSGPVPAHPLTLHLSPTSTANILVTSFVPALPASAAFAKIAPDVEVIVAPKTRKIPPRSSARENRSVTSKRSVARSGLGNKQKHEELKPPLFLRALDKNRCSQYFQESQTNGAHMPELAVWLDKDVIDEKDLTGIKYVSITLLKPAGLEVPQDPQKVQQAIDLAGDAGQPSAKVVARLLPWDDSPDGNHVALSSTLCASLGCRDIVGGVVKLEQAPLPMQKVKGSRKLMIYPFISSAGKQDGSLKFGGESKAEREEACNRINAMYGKAGSALLSGPVTDGLVLDVTHSSRNTSPWNGGILRIESAAPPTDAKQPLSWFVGDEQSFTIEILAPIAKPVSLDQSSITGLPLPTDVPLLVGIDNLKAQLESHLLYMSSVLLTGAQGSGKTSIAQLLAHQLRDNNLFSASYFPCRKLVTAETRVSNIKDTLTRVFMQASWCARLGGQSLVILDDLDSICPAETELQVGGENGRSRQISEAFCAIVKQYCGRDSNVVLVATASAKESLHNVIVGGHVVREIVNVKAPDKEARRRVIEKVTRSTATQANGQDSEIHESSSMASYGNDKNVEEVSWMDGTTEQEKHERTATDGFTIARDVDFLDLAGQTDGYMPGDLVLLVSRAQNEALIRSVSSADTLTTSAIELANVDFRNAIKGFTPASLRNVTLQTSSTTFSSIGGLHATRKILLETLQYPTTYAPIFAQCPLRLRSGLLLYGYPGCGKTMLASAVAGECGLNFISVKGPEILNKYIGASEKSVRDLFDRAEAARPCVLFFDEFDSIAPKRGHDSTGVTDRVVNQLLTQMDGAEGLSGVYVLAATSRPDLIDPALLRPGRLDKSLICDLPSLDDRVDILRALSKKLKLSTDVIDGPASEPDSGLRVIASKTEGFSGADMQALIYNAHLEAIHDVLGEDDPSKIGQKSGKSNVTNGAKEFLTFRYGAEEAAKEAEDRKLAGSNRSKELAERAAIIAKLDTIQNAKRKSKLSAKTATMDGKKSHEHSNGISGENEVTIEWKHIEKSMKGMRPSISPDERMRLRSIYSEFVDGRNGEMPSGQGGTEVGGRSSLM